MHDWRAKTKAKLDQVRAQLVTWIDTFTEKFAKSVAALEEKRSTYDLDESNRQQKARLESIRQKQQELIKIQDMYEDAEAGDQEFTLGCMRTQLAKIKTDVHAQELEIIHQAGLDRKQMDELVDVDGLEEKIKTKMVRYLMGKVGIEGKEAQSQPPSPQIVQPVYQPQMQQPMYQQVADFQYYNMQGNLMAWMEQRIGLLTSGQVVYMNQEYRLQAQ